MGRNFLHWRKFNKTQFQYFFKDVRYIFSRLKPFSGHSIERSVAFWKFSACKVCKEDLGVVSQFLRLTTKMFAVTFRCIFCVIRLHSSQKCYGRIFTIFACKNEAVCCEVQTHFGGFHLETSQKNVLSAFSRYLYPETKVFPVKFRRILEVLCLQVFLVSLGFAGVFNCLGLKQSLLLRGNVYLIV